MANINVLKRLQSIETELNAVRRHVQQYSGIDARQALAIDNTATSIALEATRIVMEAQQKQGIKSGNLFKKIRKALGFTNP